MTDECTHPGCQRPRRTKGFCAGHYARHMRGWDMDKPFRVFGNPVESFWQKVEKGDRCWLWAGAANTKGYGQQRVGGKLVLAHRLSYEIHYGPIPAGMHVDHLCWTPACVRPRHLRLLTNAENHQNLRGASAVSTSGVRGVHWVKQKRAWRAEVTLGGRSHHLGYFSDMREAEETVTAWRREHMPYSEMDKREEAV